MSLDELIAHLEKMRDEHGGETEVAGSYAAHDGEYTLRFRSVESFAKIVTDDAGRRVVIG